MATEVQITEEHDPGLFDSDTGRDLIVEKVIDITDDCRPRKRTILLFTRARRGRIVQVTHPYKGRAYMGSHIHFFIDERLGDTFIDTARRAGYGADEFAALLRSLAPPPDTGE